MTIGLLLAGGSGVSQATTTHGDLLLDDGSTGGTNTATSLGTIERELCNVTPDSTVTIDVVAVDAEDWASMDFVIYYPSPILVASPGPGDGGDAGPFDFVPFDPNDFDNTFDAENFLFPNVTDADSNYSLTEAAPDGSSAHGISMFDGSITNGNTGSGGMAHITLDTTNLAAGEHTLMLGVTSAFSGGLHSATPPAPPPPFLPDSFGAFKLAIDVPCSTDTDGDGVSDADEDAFGSDKNDADSIPESDDWLPEYLGSDSNPAGPTCSDGIDNDGDGQVDDADPSCSSTATTPTATATVAPATATATAVLPTSAQPTATATAVPPLPGTGGPPDAGSDSWLTVLYVAGGVIAAMAAAGAVSWRLRRRAARAK
ncbi:MAG: hypothetical protein IH995_09000 [Proteobacteria bacterium]|nr:hypothetical protein [Pseudomonadota bacterium]